MVKRLVAIAAAACLGLGSAQLAVAAPGGPPAPHAQPSRTITLVTGDRVRLGPGERPAVTVERVKGREHVQFLTHRTGDSHYVIPADALPLLRAGRLDRRLFDLTALAALGQRDTLPLIVTYRPGAAAQIAPLSVTRHLSSIDGAAATLRQPDAAALWRLLGQDGGGIEKVWLDGLRQPTLDVSVPQIGAPAAYRAGFTGAGVRVAVLDSGIDADHPDFAGQIAAAHNFTGEDARDRVGHGTHVASTIAGTGAASGGRYRGVAYGAKLLDGKVCETFGCFESAILAGMEWAAVEQDADVVNISLGAPDTPDTDPVEAAIDRLTADHGTLFVVAAGNSGPFVQSVDSPGSAEAALTVGAVDKRDGLAAFSSRGPRIGDGAIKPDLTAPGVDIVAANSSDGFLGHPAEDYTTLSGTSMATPHAAGAAALLAQQHPDWTAEQLKAVLIGSADPADGPTVFDQGAGRVDVATALTRTLLASPPSLSLGSQRWPHADDEPVRREASIRNTGPTPVTLALRLEITGPGGGPAPAGMFALDATEITVPPGGEAEVGVTADTRVGGPDGYYSGRLVGTSGQGAVVIPVAVDKEVESYDLTIKHIGRDGQPTEIADTQVVGVDRPVYTIASGPGGTATVRLPKGRYSLASFVLTLGEPPSSALLVRPNFEFAADTTLAADARDAAPIDVTVPTESAGLIMGIAEFARRIDLGVIGAGVFAFDLGSVYIAHLGPAAPPDELTSAVTTYWAEPDGSGWFAGSPYQYSTMSVRQGRFFTGYVRHLRPRDLATVRAEHGAQAPGRTADRGVRGTSADELVGFFGVALGGYPLPSQRSEHYYSEGGARWAATFWQVAGTGELESELSAVPRELRAGRHYIDRWNRAVFGPSVPEELVWRDGDSLNVTASLFSDHPGRLGFSVVDTGRTTLYRNGVKIAENRRPGSGRFAVPPEPAEYRLEAEATRSGVSELSSRVSLAWTFRSEGTGEVTPLPVSAVRFVPWLDRADSAPSGRPFLVPVTVHRQPGAPPSGVRALDVEVSYDDGATWRRVRLAGPGSPEAAEVDTSAFAGAPWWIAVLLHPAGPGFVSLRATATHRDGSSVQQTIIRAYRLRG